ncbi:MAG: cell division protein FtsA [Rikenellaceae bacterium]
MAEILDFIVAMDIGTTNIVTLVGERNNDGKIKIIDSTITPSKGIARGDVRNVEHIVDSIKQSIDEIEQKSNIKICEAYVGLSGEHIKCSLHTGYVFIKSRDSEVSRKDVAELSDSMQNVKVDPGQTIIHILPETYILDGDCDISQPAGMIGKKLEGRFNIVMGNRENLNHLERCFNRAKISISNIILSSLASAEAVLLDDEKELGVAVVDMGGGTCDVCIYHDKTVRYMGVIPIGGNLINKDIKSYGVLERHVEKLKIKFGSADADSITDNKVITLAGVNNIPSKAISQKVLASIIEARMMDIIQALEKMLADSNYGEKIKGPIVLTGGCANLKDVDKLFAKHLGREVRIALPTIYVDDESANMVAKPQYSTAVGLLLKGAMLGRNTKVIVPDPVEVTPEVEEVVPPVVSGEEEKEHRNGVAGVNDGKVDGGVADPIIGGGTGSGNSGNGGTIGDGGAGDGGDGGNDGGGTGGHMEEEDDDATKPTMVDKFFKFFGVNSKSDSNEDDDL